MISRIQSKFGTAGLVVAIVALVVALTGVAVAATGLNSKQKKEVTKIAKKYAGKQGPVGPQGPAGPQGAPGANGTKGDAGSEGPEGPEGKQGKQGIQGVPGEDGEPGEDGACSEGNPECVLQAGSTETGMWALNNKVASSFYPLSFTIPLETAPTDIHFVNAEEEEFVRKFNPTTEEFEIEYVTPVNCTGTVEDPTAPAGIVCIYAEKEVLAEPESSGYREVPPFERLHRSGAMFFVSIQPNDQMWGTWAVTAG